MWDLQTIIDLNEKASELAAQGRPMAEAFIAVGIDAPPKTKPELKIKGDVRFDHTPEPYTKFVNGGFRKGEITFVGRTGGGRTFIDDWASD